MSAQITSSKAAVPRPRPPIGIIHAVGSELFTSRDAATPITVPRVAAKTNPITFGQKAAFVVLHSFATPPIFGHQEKPAPILSSKTTRKFSHWSSNGAKGLADRTVSQP